MKRSLVAILLSGSFALQLLAAGSGAACVMPSNGSASGNETASADGRMAGMDMTADNTNPLPTDDSVPSQPPCDQPASLAACHIMAPCAGSFMTIPLAAVDAQSVAPSRVVAASALEPSSQTFPPELPPPRA
ncbi:MAG: hypothetical protein H0W30_13580 [Gemmatimonadaceae bacterium]|nr:hypothetical protein [Gemmatimonadaceae bacterium]MDQ3520678.1 hypothetical protein [Gemmatimonadota bacterium]